MGIMASAPKIKRHPDRQPDRAVTDDQRATLIGLGLNGHRSRELVDTPRCAA